MVGRPRDGADWPVTILRFSRRSEMAMAAYQRALSRQTLKSWSHQRIPGMLQKRCFDPSPGIAFFHGSRTTPKHRKARAGRVQKRPEPPFTSRQMIRMAYSKGGKYRRQKSAENVNFFLTKIFSFSACTHKIRETTARKHVSPLFRGRLTRCDRFRSPKVEPRVRKSAKSHHHAHEGSHPRLAL